MSVDLFLCEETKDVIPVRCYVACREKDYSENQSTEG